MTTGPSGPAAGPADAAAADSLRAAVAARAAGTPYRLEPTPDGFHLRIDLADARWWGPLGAAGRRGVVEHRVTLDPAGRTFTLTDDHLDVRWDAAADPAGPRVPRLVASAEVRRTVGRTRAVSFERTYGLDDDARPARVVDIAFRSEQGQALVRGPAAELGWTERAGTAQRVGVVAAVGGLAVALLTGAALAVLAATGRL